MMKRDPYHVLLVKRGATTQEIDAAYLRLLKSIGFFLEPGSKPYREACQVAKQSHEILSSGWMRYSYDRHGHEFWNMNLWILKGQYKDFLARQREWELAQREWQMIRYAAPEACMDGKGGIVFRPPRRVYDDRPSFGPLPLRPRNKVATPLPVIPNRESALRYV
jgi:hypothetical protein